MNGIVHLSKNFTLAEAASRDGAPVPANLMANAERLAGNLQVLREALGEAIHINSWYRTPSHNKAVGGEPNSLHMKALAADITCRSKTPKQLADLIERLIKAGAMMQGGLGIYRSWVHYDCRGEKKRWRG